MVDGYDASAITVLKGLEPIRKRPGMFFGDLESGEGFFHMLMEIVSNSVDQFLAGHATEISIFLHNNGDVEVIDDGDGMPIYDYNGKSAIEAIMTLLHTSATWDNHSPHAHVGNTIGVGLAAVNALCDYLIVDTYKNGDHWYIRFDDGETQGLENKGAAEKVGTRILFHPSKKYFPSLIIDKKAITARLEELAFLCAGLKINFYVEGEAEEEREEYFCSRGLAGYLESVIGFDKNAHFPLFYFESEKRNTKVELALAWPTGKKFQRSFANHLCTIDGGVHVDAVAEGVAKAVTNVFPQFEYGKTLVQKVSKAICFIVHVNIADPKFASPTKDRLANPEVFKDVVELVYERARHFLLNNKVLALDLKNNL